MGRWNANIWANAGKNVHHWMDKAASLANAIRTVGDAAKPVVGHWRGGSRGCGGGQKVTEQMFNGEIQRGCHFS
jgi:hypothetical protein